MCKFCAVFCLINKFNELKLTKRNKTFIPLISKLFNFKYRKKLFITNNPIITITPIDLNKIFLNKLSNQNTS